MTINMCKTFTGLVNQRQHSPLTAAGRLARLRAKKDPQEMDEFLSYLNVALPFKGMTPAEIKKGVDTIIDRIRMSPIHIGFQANGNLFSEDEFLPGGTYKSRHVLYEDKYGSLAKGKEDPNMPNHHQPIYGALNFSGIGHIGWGRSAIVLKPHMQKFLEIHSRDTGESLWGLGEFCAMGDIDNIVPLLKDWLKTDYLQTVWPYLTEDRPVPEKLLRANSPLEAAIYREGSIIKPDDIGLILIDQTELHTASSPSEQNCYLTRKRALNNFQNHHNIEVVIADFSKEKPLSEIPGYLKLQEEYRKAVMSSKSVSDFLWG